jgi:REP element-mobilizing transposase RayT
MARSLRIQFPGAFYHVTSRGNRRQPIFLTDEDRYFFLNCLRDAHDKFGVVIHVYCLMENHYHLFMETPRGQISKIMHLINMRYSSYFNLKHARCGHTFQARFSAILVQAEEYARELASYIHLNPVRAGIVNRPEDYVWSNYREYLGIAAPQPWTANSFVLRLFGASLADARNNYEEYVAWRLSQKLPSPLEAAKKTGILGNADFVKRIRKSFLSDTNEQPVRDLPQLRKLFPRPGLQQIFTTTESALGSKNRFTRNLSILISHKLTDYTLKEIGEFYKLGVSGITDICRRTRKELIHNDTLARAIGEIERRLRS